MPIASYEYKQLLRELYPTAKDEFIELMNDCRLCIKSIEAEAAYYSIYMNLNLDKIKEAIKTLEAKFEEFKKLGGTVHYEHCNLYWKDIHDNDKKYIRRIYIVKDGGGTKDLTNLLIFRA